MKIENIKIACDGFVLCKSKFYTVHDLLSTNCEFKFNTGANYLFGEIDSGIFAISYLMSMYKHAPKNSIVIDKKQITINDNSVELEQLSELSCYIDESNPMFSTKKSVKRLIEEGIKKSKINTTTEEIIKLFKLSSDRIMRPIKQVGNESLRAMSAVAFAYGKELFCFPWLSKKRFDYYGLNITHAIDVLSSLGKIVIIPTGA